MLKTRKLLTSNEHIPVKVRWWSHWGVKSFSSWRKPVFFTFKSSRI